MKTAVKAYIVDDEKNCRELIKKYLAMFFKNIQLVGEAEEVGLAIAQITELKPNLLFLDVQVKDREGFEIINEINAEGCEIIFITAHDHYALKAIKNNACDYILKPILVEEFFSSVKKAIKNIEQKGLMNQEGGQAEQLKGQLSLPIKEGLVFIEVKDIIRLESDGGYTTIYTTDGLRYVVSKNLIEYESILSGYNCFFRAHKSHLINLKKVKKFLKTQGNFIEMEGGHTIELARRKKDEFMELMAIH